MINWLQNLLRGEKAKNISNLSEEEQKEEIQSFVKSTKHKLFEGHVRHIFSSKRTKSLSVCPRCGSKTKQHTAVFVCATNTIPQTIITTEAYFCTNCSTAIVKDKVLQKSCEKEKVYRGIIGISYRGNTRTYDSLNEYLVRYSYDQKGQPSGMKVTGEKVPSHDPEEVKRSYSPENGGTKPISLMDRVAQRDRRENLSKQSSRRKNNKSRDEKEIRHQKSRKSVRSKHQNQEEFQKSVSNRKTNFEKKVNRKNEFSPKSKQKPIVENPNDDSKQNQLPVRSSRKNKEQKQIEKNKGHNQRNSRNRNQNRFKNKVKNNSKNQEGNSHISESKQDTKPEKNTESKHSERKNELIEKIQQNLQQSSQIIKKGQEEKPKEQQKESSRLARLKEEDEGKKVSTRRPRRNVRTPIDLDLKNVNSRRRYNNTKKK